MVAIADTGADSTHPDLSNAAGVTSIAWSAWIMPVRVSLADGSAYDSTIANGIVWAADHGARVVNVSYYISGSSTMPRWGFTPICDLTS